MKKHQHVQCKTAKILSQFHILEILRHQLRDSRNIIFCSTCSLSPQKGYVYISFLRVQSALAAPAMRQFARIREE